MICACSILLILLLWSSQPSRYCILILLAFVEVTLQNSCWILIVSVCLRQRWVLTCIMNSLISSSRLLESWYLSFYIFFTQLHIPLMKNYVLSWELSRDLIYLFVRWCRSRKKYLSNLACQYHQVCMLEFNVFILSISYLCIYLFVYLQAEKSTGLTKSIAAFFSKRCMPPPVEIIKPRESSPQPLLKTMKG